MFFLHAVTESNNAGQDMPPALFAQLAALRSGTLRVPWQPGAVHASSASSRASASSAPGACDCEPGCTVSVCVVHSSKATPKGCFWCPTPTAVCEVSEAFRPACVKENTRTVPTLALALTPSTNLGFGGAPVALSGSRTLVLWRLGGPPQGQASKKTTSRGGAANSASFVFIYLPSPLL